MPKRCAVKNCKNLAKLKFPKDKELRKKWLEAIQKPQYISSHQSGICENHFSSQQNNNESKKGGYKLNRLQLFEKEAVPCIFRWTSPKVDEINNERIVEQESLTIETDHAYCIEEVLLKEEYELDENITCTHDSSNLSLVNNDSKKILKGIVLKAENDITIKDIFKNYSEYKFKESKTNYKSIDEITQNILNEHRYSVLCIDNHENPQKNLSHRYQIKQFKYNPRGLHYFTGIESYDKFMTIYNTLGRKILQLTYHEQHLQKELSAEDKLFLTLWKLRRNCDDFELSQHFCISEIATKIILKKMLFFMANQWSVLDIWPTEDFIKTYMPQDYISEKLYISKPANCEGQNRFKKVSSDSRKRHLNLSSLQVHVRKNIKGFQILSERLDPTYIPLISEITGICMTLCIFKELIKK